MANTYTWTLPAGSAASGGTASDWSPSGPPGPGATGILENGGTILLADATFHSNTLILGAGELLFSGDTAISEGSPTFDQSTTLTTDTGLAAAHSTVVALGTFISQGTIIADGATGSTLSIAIGNTVGAGTIDGWFENDGYMLVGAGNTLSLTGTAGASFADPGTLDVEGGSAVISATPAATNFLENNSANANYIIGAGGSLEIGQSNASLYTDIAFNGNGWLKLDQAGNFNGAIENFGTGDTIDLGSVNIAKIVFDGNGDIAALNSSGGTVFAASVSGNNNNGSDGPLDGYGNAGTYTLSGSGGTAAYLTVTEGSGDTVLTAQPFPGPSVWLWKNGASASAETPADWTVYSGPGNAFNEPMQPGDAVINPGGTILLGSGSNFNDNTLTVGGTASAAALVMNGDTNQTSFGDPTLNDTSVIDSDVPFNSSAETTLIDADGQIINEGSILANGPAGSHFTLAIGSGSVTNYPSGTAVVSFQPGYFFNTNLIEATQGNTLTIQIGANAELFNGGEILSDGGDVIIAASTSAIAGGMAPERGIVGIAGGGTVEVNVTYASTLGGTTQIYEFEDHTANNTLKIDNVASFSGRIIEFGAGDTIDLGTIGPVASLSYSNTTNILDLENSGGTVVASLLIGSGAFTNTGTAVQALSGGAADGFVVGSLVSNGTTDTVLTTSLVTPNADGVSGAWQSTSVWANGTLPAASDTPSIGLGSTAAFTLTTGASAVSVAGINITDPNATLEITSNTTSTAQSVTTGSGTLVVESGETLTTAALVSTEPSANITVDANAVIVETGHLNTTSVPVSGTLGVSIGNNYANVFSAGTVTVDGAILAGPSAGGGGGGSTSIGYDSNVSANVTVAAGGTVTDTYMLLSSDPSSAGTLTVTGAGASWSDNIDSTDTTHLTGAAIIGYNNLSPNSTIQPLPTALAAAQLTIENSATMTEQSGAYLGNTVDSAGDVTVQAGGVWNLANNGTGFLAVGFQGAGTLDIQSGGTVLVGTAGTFYTSGTAANTGTTFVFGGIQAGQSAGASGTIVVGGGGGSSLLSTLDGMVIGGAGQAELDILNGGTVLVQGAGSGAGNGSGSGTILVGGGGGSSAAVMLFGSATPGTAAAKGLGLGNAANGSGTLIVSDNGTITLNGTGGIAVGQSAGAQGLMIVGGSSIAAGVTSTTNGLNVGQAGTGTLELNSLGTIALNGTGGVNVGQSAGATGTVSINGGLLTLGGSAGSFNVGLSGGASGTLNVGSGTIEDNGTGYLQVGQSANAVGVVTVGGMGSPALVAFGTAGLTVGNAGTGAVTVYNEGTIALNGTGGVNVGFIAGGSGTLTVSGGTVMAAGSGGLSVGTSGNGTVSVTNGGTLQVQSYANIGLNSGSNGTVTVNGGLLALTGGTSGMTLGSVSGASGTLVVQSGVADLGGYGLQVGQSGTGVAEVLSGATLNIDSTGTLTSGIGINSTGGSGVLIVASGGVVNDGTTGNAFGLTVGQGSGGQALLNIESGGSFFVGDGAISVATSAGAPGVIDVGGLLDSTDSAGVSIGSGGTIVMMGGTLSANVVSTNIAAGGLLTGYGKVVSNLSNSGTVIAAGGALELTGGLAGTMVIDPGATLKLDSGVLGGASIGFATGSAGTLILGSIGGVNNFAITNLQTLDRIEFAPGITATGAALNGTTLTVDVTGTNAPGSTIKIVGVSAASGTPGFVTGTDAATGDSFIQATNQTLAADRTLSWIGTAGSASVAVASNWDDLTDGLNPASVAPGTADTAEFLGGGGTLSGAMTVASLQFGGGGAYDVSGGAVLGAQTIVSVGAGVLAISAGGTVAGGGAGDIISGTTAQIAGVSISGASALWSDAGTLTVGGTGLAALAIDGGGAVTTNLGAAIATSTAASGSSVNVIGAGSKWQVGSTLAVGAGGSGQLSVAQGASVTVGALSVGAVAGGGGLVSVQGTGSDVIVSGALSVGGAASGDLEIQGGALVSAASGSIGTGAAGIIVVGVGSTLSVPGILNVGGAAVADAGELYLEGGTFVGGTAGAVDYGAHGFLVVSDNGVFDANPTVTVTGNTYNGSSIEAEVEIVNGATTFAKAPNVGQALNVFLAPLITYAGSTAPSALKPDLWTINTDGTLELDANTVDKSQEFSFADNTGVLWIGQQVTINTSNNPQTIQAAAIGGFSGLIDSYSTGDQIIVDTANPAGFNYNTVAPTGTITVNDLSGGALEGVLTFDTTEEAQAVWADYQAFQAGSLAASPLVDMALACFAAGTRIETPEGPVAVEDLAVGGTVVTLPGGSGRIVWTGSRAVDCTRHPRPEAVWPVRVSAGAFGPGMPARDLFLSPDHAVYVEDVLIPVKHLVNGDSIHQVPMEHVVYHHIELERHDVVLAEGLAAESYLDTGDRADFGSESTVIRLHPMFERTADAAMLWETRGAAPLVQSGAVLERVRAHLRGRDRRAC